MKVCLLRGYWPADGSEKLKPGKVLDLPAGEAKGLIERGIAEDANGAGDFDSQIFDTSDIADAALRLKLSRDLDALVKHRATHSSATVKAYRYDFTRFERWCRARYLKPLPTTPETLSRYLLHRASEGIGIGTLRREASAIGSIHAHTHMAPLNTQLVSETMKALDGLIYAGAQALRSERGGAMIAVSDTDAITKALEQEGTADAA